MNQDQTKTSCRECWLLKNQTVPAHHYWDKWLCKNCYSTQQINWIIWEEQFKQAIADYLTNSQKVKVE